MRFEKETAETLSVKVCELRHGEGGVITNSSHEGSRFVRYGDILLKLGSTCSIIHLPMNDVLIRKDPPGTKYVLSAD